MTTNVPDSVSKTDGNPENSLDKLWEAALNKYKAKTKRTEDDLLNAKGFEEALKTQSDISKQFDDERHPQNKRDTVIKAVKGCLGWVTAGTAFVAQHASGTAAMPAKFIAGAVTYLVEAAQNVSKDLDLIVEVFKDLSDTMGDTSLFKHMPTSYSHFHTRLMEVFVSLMEFCGFATNIFKNHGRLRLYVSAFGGRNEKVRKRSNAVKEAIRVFRNTISATNLAVAADNLAVAEDNLALAVGIDKKVTGLAATLEAFKTLPTSALQFPQQNNPLTSLKKLLKHYSEDKAQTETQTEIKAQYVEGTFEWVKEDPEYKQWLGRKRTPFLLIHGPTGCGKTYLTYYLQETLRRDARKRQKMSVASLLFEPARQESQSLASVLLSIVIQIAEQDPKYCELIVKELQKKSSKETNLEEDAKSLWEKFLQGKFDKSSDSLRTVYILLDSFHQVVEPGDFEVMLDMFKRLDCRRHSIQILLTGSTERDIVRDIVQQLKPYEIRLKDKTPDDIKKVIKHRFETSGDLKALSQETQKDISNFLSDQADGDFSKVDIALNRIEQIGNDKAALDEMKRKLKGKGSEGLYPAMIDLITSSRSPQEMKSIRSLFAWTILAKRELSIHETNCLLDLEDASENFNIQEEINGLSRSVLYIRKRRQDGRNSDSLMDIAGDSRLREDGLNDDGQSFHPNQDKDGSDFITFRQPQLKEYLLSPKRESELIPDILEDKVKTFATLCNIICNNTRDKPRRALQEYAVLNLVDHLEDIEIKDANEEQTSKVIDGLFHILTNANDAHLVIEDVLLKQSRWGCQFQLYDDFNSPDVAIKETILHWVRKMCYIGHKALSSDVQAWLASTIKRPSRMLESLARGHIESWFSKVTVDEASIPHRLAVLALSGTDHLKESVEVTYDQITSKRTIMAVFDVVRKMRKKKPMREAGGRIAAALLLNSPHAPEEDKDYARDLYKENLKDTSTEAERFYSFVGLAEYHYNGKQYEMAADAAENAIKVREAEQEALGTDLDNERATKAFLLWAYSLQKCGSDSEALKVYERGLAKLKECSGLVNLVEETIRALAKLKDYRGIIQRVQALSKRFRAKWMEWRMFERPGDIEGEPTRYGFGEDDPLRRAAVETRRTDYLIQLYEEAIEHWQPISSQTAMFLQYQLAVIYRRDIRTSTVARDKLNQMLEACRSDPESLFILMIVLQELVDIIFEQYSMTDNPEVRKLAVVKLKELVDELADSNTLGTTVQAGAFLTLARMFRGSENLAAAKGNARKAFQLCIGDLEDNFGYNDAEAFRMLAKVLMFANLEADARIALSLQFSEVDKSYADAVNEDPGDISPKSESVSDDGSVVSASTSASADRTLQNGTHISPVPFGADVHEKALPHQRHEEDDGKIAKTNALLSTTEVQPNGYVTPTVDNVNTIDPESGKRKDSAETSGIPKEPVSDEDLALGHYSEIFCNGPCPYEVFREWKVGAPTWRCLDCGNVDLCQQCYDIQQAFNGNRGDGFWTKICWDKHKFLEQPIEKWQGVKDGIIRRDNKRKPFREWLLDVRKRWEEALQDIE